MTRTGGGPESAVWATAATGAAASRPNRGRIVPRMVLSFASKTVTAPETRTPAPRCQPSSGQTFWDSPQPTPCSVWGQWSVLGWRDEDAEPVLQRRYPPPTWRGLGWGVDAR